MRRRSRTATAFAAAVACYFIACSSAPSYALLIDDFSLDQVGISAGENAVFDGLNSPQLFGGSRVIWGGASSPCDNCFKMTAIGGQMIVNPGGVAAGSGAVSWSGSLVPSDRTSMTVDLSGYAGLELDIAELTGTVNLRFSIGSGSGPNDVSQRGAFINSPGHYTFYFADFTHTSGSQPLNLHDIRYITLATGVDAGESIAYNSISVVPEPSAFVLMAVGFLGLMPVRQRR